MIIFSIFCILYLFCFTIRINFEYVLKHVHTEISPWNQYQHLFCGASIKNGIRLVLGSKFDVGFNLPSIMDGGQTEAFICDWNQNWKIKIEFIWVWTGPTKIDWCARHHRQFFPPGKVAPWTAKRTVTNGV